MKNLYIFAGIIFVITKNLAAMEEGNIGKELQEGTPLLCSSVAVQNCHEHSAFEIFDKDEYWTYHIAKLPSEIKIIIWRDLFHIGDERAVSINQFETYKLLDFYYKSLEISLLFEGNESFKVAQLLSLKSEEKKLLKKSKSYYISDSDYVLFCALPKNIIQDMRVTPNLPIPEESCDILAKCCMGAGCCCGGIGFCIVGCLTGCHASPLWWIPGGIMLTCNIALPCFSGWIRHGQKCGCLGKVNYRVDLFQ